MEGWKKIIKNVVWKERKENERKLSKEGRKS